MAVYLGVSMPSFYLGNTPVQLYLGNTLVSGEYETITDSEEAYSKIVPAGGKYASIKAIGGKSVVIDNALVSAAVESIKYNDAIICEIPADVRSLFGYGWSAGAAYNSIERTESGWQYVQRVKKYTFTGSESWTRYGTTSAWISYDLSDAAFAAGSTIISIDLNGCVSGSGTSYSNDGDCWLQATSAYKRLYVCNSAATTEQDMKQFTAGKTIYYPLATPIITDITSIMGDFKNRFAVGAGGTITFENAANLSVPNTVEYTVQK